MPLMLCWPIPGHADRDAAADFAPHDVAFYLRDLAAAFHRYYAAERFLVTTTPRPARMALLAPRARCCNGWRCWACQAPGCMGTRCEPAAEPPRETVNAAGFAVLGVVGGLLIRPGARAGGRCTSPRCRCPSSTRSAGTQPPNKTLRQERTRTGTERPLATSPAAKRRPRPTAGRRRPASGAAHPVATRRQPRRRGARPAAILGAAASTGAATANRHPPLARCRHPFATLGRPALRAPEDAEQQRAPGDDGLRRPVSETRAVRAARGLPRARACSRPEGRPPTGQGQARRKRRQSALVRVQK